MRVTVLGLCVLVGIGVYAVASHAQQQQRTPAPTTAAKFWTLEEQNQHQKELMTTKMTNWPFYQEDKFNTEMRNLTGKQPVLVHGKRADFMMIPTAAARSRRAASSSKARLAAVKAT
jgi:hypothetical protein